MNTAQGITYQALIDCHITRYKKESSKAKDLRIIEKFMAQRQRRRGDLVAWEFEPEEREKCIRELDVNNKRKTRNTMRSALNKLAETLSKMKGEGQGPVSLQDRLAAQIAKREITVKEVSRRTSVPLPVLYSWMRNGLTNAKEKAIGRLKVLEAFFRTAEGHFTGSVRFSEPHRARQMTEFGRVVQTLIPLEYRFKFRAWPDPLKEEFLFFVAFKSTTMAGVAQDPDPGHFWRAGGRRASMTTVQSYFESFFGFLTASPESGDPRLRGMGYSPGDLSIALCADVRLIEAYLQFMKVRRGRVTETHTNFLRLVVTLLNPRWGFLTVFSEKFRDKGPNPAGSPEEWAGRCSDAGEYCSRYIKVDGRLVKGKGRRAFEPIMHLVTAGHPLDSLDDLVSALKAGLRWHPNPLRLAVAVRNLLLVMLLVEHPLRIEMFAYMRLGVNLVKGEDGAWFLKFHEEQFKNEQGAAGHTYNEPVEKELWPWIDAYVNVHRPLLVCGAGKDFVFLPATHERGTFSRVVAVDEGEGTVTLQSKGGRVRTVDISRAKYAQGIGLGDKIAVKREMSGPGLPCRNEKGMEVGRTVRRGREQSALWAMDPVYLSMIIRKITRAVPGPDGKPGTGFGPHAFRHLVATDFLISHPGQYERLAYLLQDKFLTVLNNYVWLERLTITRQYQEERRLHRLERQAKTQGGPGHETTGIPNVG